MRHRETQTVKTMARDRRDIEITKGLLRVIANIEERPVIHASRAAKKDPLPR